MLDKKTAEIHCLYVKPEFRGNKFADMLMENVASRKEFSYLAVTYSAGMKIKLMKLGFKRLSFFGISFAAKLGFLKTRAKKHRIAEIIKRFGKNKKTYFFIK